MSFRSTISSHKKTVSAALVALILYPLVWLILLPFRLVGIVVGGTFELIAALFYLPGKMLRAI